ncbi:ECF RNA polymerase sigma factor SigD [Pirellulimonas nuda]|uniref:ECF RNA polymerase sigma factor SigD n=1 Tax=Pirellulimonas nuda TaxID=2528009 RepID=A0A518DDF9_9BACT|nr:sigma-70 family RNA polymerase sigma factor [Pirellulimonas nuda]QDU89476.1 ECF RNA polymerase sigma factor SigD [Pirellulimonas nuda]
MTTTAWPDPSSDCLQQARNGDRDAASRILEMYRGQLKRVVAARLDSRLAARLDPSDVVHDVMMTACHSLPSWIGKQKAVYACLHRLTRDRISALYREHVTLQKRSVNREAVAFDEFADDSVMLLCQRLGANVETPSQAAVKRESQTLVREALSQLRVSDREVLVMRTLEGTPANEVAQILGVSEAAVHMRQMRALDKMRVLLGKLQYRQVGARHGS